MDDSARGYFDQKSNIDSILAATDQLGYAFTGEAALDMVSSLRWKELYGYEK